VTFETKNFAGKALRRALVCSASVAVLGLGATPAFAQDEPAGNEDDRPIVVTGSRLVTSGMESPVPVTAVEAEQLEAMDPSSLIASVSQLPQFLGNSTPNFSAFFTRGGTGNLNLRGLGANRTLTLLNGKRVPSSSAFGGVDINLFPSAMIRGIETTTGGASAAYGTDAVAGVVNFLLDTDFEGLEVEAQGGISGRGDAENYQVSVSTGIPIGDRGHFLVSLSKAEQKGVHDLYSRDWYQNVGAVNTGTAAAPYWRDFPDTTSATASFDGIIFSNVDVDPNTAGVQNPINGLQFNSAGGYAPFVPGSILSGAIGNGGRTVGGSGDDLNGERFTLYPDTDRYSLFAYADYELADNFTVFAQYLRGYNHQFQWNTPRSSLFGSPTAITIFADNAYLPQGIKDLMTTNNIASFNLRRFGSIEDIGEVWFEDRTTQNVGTAGFEYNIDSGGFMDGWQINGYYQYGHSRRVWDQHSMRIDRIFAAIDAVNDGSGNIVCRVTLDPEGAAAFPGCQPLNLFGRGNATDAAVDYVMGNDVGLDITTPLWFANLGNTGETLSYTSVAPKRNITTFEQHFAEVSAAGDLFDLPAGPVSLAFGASYREESIYQVVQDTANRQSNHDGAYRPCSLATAAALGLRGLNAADCNNTVAFQFSKVSNIQGAATVKEAFAETLVPIFENDSGASASLNLAGRWADYSGSGIIWAYKGGLDIAFVEGFRLRGTYSRDVRAGNLSERFDKTGGAGNIIDRRTTAQNPTWGGQTYQVTIFSGGNPNIAPEKADTYTVGAVFQPEFLPGFSASVDWYQVHIKGAISTVGNQGVVDRCFQDGEQSFCDLITLDSTDNNKIILVGNQFVNVAQSAVEGIDAEFAYRTDLNWLGNDSLSTRVFMSWLLDRSDTGATGVVTQFDGLTGVNPETGGLGLYPHFRATGSVNYRNGPFNLFMQGRVVGSGIRARFITTQNVTPAPPAIEGVNIEDNSTPAVFYMDLRASYELPIGDSSIELWGSVTNLFDRSPPVEGTYSTFTGQSIQYNAGLFDVLGRRFTIGAKFKL
jgi:iron complex outermembrane receptor protein